MTFRTIPLHLLCLVGLCAGLSLALPASAQIENPFKALFGPKTQPAKTATPKTPQPEPKAEPKAKSEGAMRAMEIQVELAWLGDPLTFPYFLEARINGPELEVRGYVPGKAVRDQAVKLARLQCGLPVTDLMKEHASVAVRPSQMTAAQLQRSVQTALTESFGPGAQSLKIHCQADGAVRIEGEARSLDQKLAVSQALRRLHGCTSVSNQLQVAADVDAPLNRTSAKTATPNTTTPNTAIPATPTATAGADKKEQKKGGLFGWFTKAPAPGTKTTANKSPTPLPKITTAGGEPGTNDQGKTTGGSTGYETKGTVIVSGDEPDPSANPSAANPPKAKEPAKKDQAKAMAGTAAAAARLKKRIEAVCPGVRQVQVTFTSATTVRIEFTARAGDDVGQLAGQVLSLKELEAYQPDLRIEVPHSK